MINRITNALCIVSIIAAVFAIPAMAKAETIIIEDQGDCSPASLDKIAKAYPGAHIVCIEETTVEVACPSIPVDASDEELGKLLSELPTECFTGKNANLTAKMTPAPATVVKTKPAPKACPTIDVAIPGAFEKAVDSLPAHCLMNPRFVDSRTKQVAKK